MKFWLIIPAAGIGSRMQNSLPKQYLQVAGKSILQHTLDIFLNHQQLQQIILPLASHDQWWPQLGYSGNPRIKTITGGAERADSVYNGLRYLLETGAAPTDWVLVHDAARPLLQQQDLAKLLSLREQESCGGLLAYPAKDTLKLANSAQQSIETLPRQQIWHALTPQMFRLQPLFDALDSALKQGAQITDEASAMELAGHQPQLVAGRSDNIKITTPEDLQLMQQLLANSTLHGESS